MVRDPFPTPKVYVRICGQANELLAIGTERVIGDSRFGVRSVPLFQLHVIVMREGFKGW